MSSLYRVALGAMTLAAIAELFLPDLFAWMPFQGGSVVLSGLLVMVLGSIVEIYQGAKGFMNGIDKQD